MGFLDTVKFALYFETIRLVTVQSWRLGVLYRLMQIAVFMYIALYAIWYKKGYQASSSIDGVVFTKIKGVAQADDNNTYDASDLVVPPSENLAAFLATSFRETNQDRSQCIDFTAPTCLTNADCLAGNATDNGFRTGYCNVTTTPGYCVINGWCPVENDLSPIITVSGLENFTIFIRSSISYTNFNVKYNNADRVALDYNLFTVQSILTSAGTNLSAVLDIGAVIGVQIDWTCNLDNQACSPVHRFTVFNAGSGSQGFNFRTVLYSSGNLSSRLLIKYYGLRFIFVILGTGARFDFAATVVTVGSALTFLTVATLLTDFILQYLHPRKRVLNEAKREFLDLNTDQVGDKDSRYNEWKS